MAWGRQHVTFCSQQQPWLPWKHSERRAASGQQELIPQRVSCCLERRWEGQPSTVLPVPTVAQQRHLIDSDLPREDRGSKRELGFTRPCFSTCCVTANSWKGQGLLPWMGRKSKHWEKGGDGGAAMKKTKGNSGPETESWNTSGQMSGQSD